MWWQVVGVTVWLALVFGELVSMARGGLRDIAKAIRETRR
jgi:hypothetical protein